MLQFPEVWHLRPPRATVVDEGTGNPIPGPPPPSVAVRGSLEQRFPTTQQSEVGTVLVDERVLVLEPAVQSKVPGFDDTYQALDADGTVWSVVRIPKVRKRRRPSAPTRYVAAIVRRATDIKEN